MKQTLNKVISMLLCLSMLLNSVSNLSYAMENFNSEMFKDVSPSDWFYESVNESVKDNIFSGSGNDTFSPNDSLTRAMYVTIMGRIAQVDNNDSIHNAYFTDLDADAYYVPYVIWAVEKGITQGIGNNQFGPNSIITREQLATFTVRYFDAYDISYPESTVSTLPKDLNEISPWAQEAVLKLWKSGLLKGDEKGNFNPGSKATRAEAAAFSVRINENVKESNTELVEIEAPVQKPDRKSASYYQLSFKSNGGSTVESFSRREGGNLSNLPVPYKEDSVFAGWCYDKELTKLVGSNDVVRENLTLYAKWSEAVPLAEDETKRFASAIDQNKNFTITIRGLESMTADEVENLISVENFNSQEDKDWIDVTKSGSDFIISGLNYTGQGGTSNTGFEEGASYKLTLNDERLIFDGFPQETRDFNFTIKKEDVFNLSLNEKMDFIKFEDISDIKENGISTDSIKISPMTVTEDGIGAGDMVEGTFTYNGQGSFAVGDTVSIYEGIHPNERVLDDTREGSDGNTSYIEITSVSGTTYGYKTADVEDVLFTPDVLPVSVDADTDGNSNNNSITIGKDVMDYSDDMYAVVGLDSQTTVDKGDYISFYDGDLNDSSSPKQEGFGLITEVTVNIDSYIIDYEEVTLDELLAAMDMYNTDPIDGDELLEGVDIAAVEAQIEQQAVDSGFAEDAGHYLAAMALETDSFTKISEDFELRNYQILNERGESLSLDEVRLMDDGGMKVEVEVSPPEASISTDLEHFEDTSGLRLTLKIKAEITIGPKMPEDGDGQVVITLTGEFEEEVHVGINVDGGARWEWWAIFPYIAEYEVTANIDLYNYTGLKFNASIVTKEYSDDKWTEDEDLSNVVDELKTLVDEVKDGLGSEEEDDPANYLIEKYKSMMETESDWVTLVEKEIYEYSYRIPPIMIIEIKMEIKFVIQANMNISLGAEFWYMTAKRYSYNVEVFAKNVTSDVLDLVEEQYEFTFYVMGTLGLRAGISIEAKVCLFDEKFASVGFSAEAGAYIKMYGYFFYQLTYKASAGRDSKYSGALYFELGIYLEVAFEAQAFAGTFSYNPTLYENEWPLWSAGMRENIQDFAYSEDEEPEISMKKSIKTTFVPDSVFEMLYLDLKTGDAGTKIYDDSEQYFTIEMTNNKFRYDRTTNSLTITPEEKDIQLDGQMVISWINQPLAWTSKPISTRINLHWDNLNDGYAIVFHSNGGSSIPIIIKKYGEAIISPSDPVKKGYIFDGWYSDKGFTQKYTIPETMPNVDMEVYAKWTPATDTPYKIEHYGEVLGSSQYELLETVPLTGTTDSTVLAATKEYMGYITPESRQITISPDGSSILRYYYDREIYTLTFSPGEALGENIVSKLQYGAKITAPSFISKGYAFTGWDSEFPVDGKMPAKDLTYTAQWTPSDDTHYRVEYYVEQINGKYTLQRLDDSKTGTTGSTVDIQNIFDNSFIVQNGITYKDTTVNGKVTNAPVIAKDGKLIIKVNYQRDSHDAIFKPDNGEENTVISVKYQGSITAPMQNPIKQGYVFDGWEGYTVGDTMGTADIYYIAKWKPATDNYYTVKHIREDLSGNYPSSGNLVEVETKIGTTDAQTEAQAKTYQGFTSNVFTQTKVLPDGTAVVEIKYSRNSYTVNWIANDQAHKTEQVKYGVTITEPTINPTKLGYKFAYWNGFAAGATMGATDQSYTATWTANQYKVSFESNGGTKYNDITVTYDGKYSSLPSPTREGYDFEGWFTASENGEQVTAETKVAITEDQTLWAHWTAKNYNVSFDLDTGTGTSPEEISVTYGDSYTVLPENSASKVGYTFAGWYTAAVGGTKITSDTKVTTAQDHTLYARWTANKYNVTFNANGGEAVNPITVTYDSSYGTLPVPTYAGYHFVNWIDENGAVVAANTTVKITSDHELKAEWVANEATPYTVRHYQQNIESDSYTQYGDDVIKYGKTDTDTIAVANTYEGFTSKEFSQKKIGGNGLTVVDIYYDRNSYTVNWISEGETYKTEQVKYGASIQPPTVKPTKLGYVFKAWSGFDEGAVMGITQQDFTATWTPATDTAYTVNHIREDLNGEYTILEKVTEKGTTGEHTLASPKTYNGFTADIDYAQVEIKADGSSVVSIFYNRNSYDIAWIANNINYETTKNIKYGAIVPLPSGTPDNKTGYTFDGWIGVPDTMPAQNSSYEASWTANTYTVTFNVNRGNALTEDTKQVIFDSAYGPLPTTTCAGFTFIGWIDINNATVNEDTIVKNASDHSLTATWKADTDVAYTVEHYKQNINDDGYTKYFSDIKFGETDTNTEAVANSYEGFNVLDYNQTPIAGDGSTVVEIYYDRNIHTITWNIDRTLQTYNYRYGETILAPDAEKTGYKFTGWNTSVVNNMPDKDLSYTATWTANQYKLSFESNGGTKYNDITVTYDGKYSSLPSPTREGYDFEGWFTASENGEQVTAETKVAITEDQTLWAHWTAKNYNVSFDLNTGTGTSPEAISVTYGDSYTVLPENSASKVGYTFDGWYTAAAGGTKITSDTKVTTAQDHTLYARWTANKYTVSFNADGGEAVNPITVTYDSSYGTLPVPTYAGYHFVNWIDENGAVVAANTIVKITSDHELKAEWVANEATPYTVRHYQQNIESDGYTQYGDDVIKYGKTDTDTNAAANTYEGFTAKEFSQKKIGGNGLTVVEIYYDRSSYTVNWISEGETYKTEQVKYGASIQPPTVKPTKLGYVFKAWSGFDDGSVMGITQLDFTATWTANQYNVSFEGNGGTKPNDITVTYDGKYSSLPTPTREGYDFAGWFTASENGEQVTSETKVEITEDQILWAHWTAKNYSVSFNLNTGTGTALEAISVIYGDSYTGLPENSASKDGYTFAGWYTAASGGTKITGDSKVTTAQDHTLYAQWTANQYIIVFEGNGSDGGQMVNQVYTYDQPKSLDINRFTRIGHTFAGWNTQADGKGTSYTDTASISNLAEIGSVSLYAQWNINQYTISFNSDGGTTVTALTQNYGTTITAPAPPTKNGYTFGSWQKNGVDFTFSTMPAENITLTARWNIVDYTIDYVLSGGMNDAANPSSYNIESDNITLGDASGKAGYTFGGWYTDAIFTNKVGSIAIVKDSTGSKTFYAKWEPNTYTVKFHKNIGDGITVDQSFTYDEASKALTANSFIRNGYSFSGWSTNSDGSGTIYTDKQMVQNLVESGIFNLYAKWNLETYNIQYVLNGGTQATGQITSFTVLSNDITLMEPTRGNGYGFIGWYDNAAFTGSKITTITKGSTGNKTLYAKWGFAGTFTVTNNGGNTFTITRNGNGTQDAQNVGQQTVYFRTINGSAIGGTHFVHQGGNSAAVTFAEGVTSQTVTVTEYLVTSAYGGIGSTKYSNADRTYQLEIVKVVGGGLLGSNKVATRTMTKDSNYVVASDAYNYKSFASHSVSTQISEKINGSYNSTQYTGLSGNPLTGRSDSTDIKTYLQDTASAMKVKLDIKGADDGWRMYRHVLFNNHASGTDTGKSDSGLASLPTGTKAGIVYGVTNNTDNRASYIVKLPAANGGISTESGSEAVPAGGVSVFSGSYASGQSGNYVLYNFDETCGISVGAYNSASAISSWWYQGGTLYSAPLDTNEPIIKGIAPMATGDYKAGETVTIAVVFDEIVANVNGASISGTNLNTMTYAGGVNTNVLYFTGTVKTDSNQDTILTGITLNGPVLDMAN